MAHRILSLLLFASIVSAAPKSSLRVKTNGQNVEHALNRLTFGPRPGDAELVRKMGLNEWIELQLHPERIAENPQLAEKLAPLKTLESREYKAFPKDDESKRAIRQMVVELTQAKLYRAVLSERQLEEVLVDFWFNHFNVFLEKGAVRWLATSYERDAIRPHVLGKFEDLVKATAQHPAMLFYLDNWQSVSPEFGERLNRARKGKARVKGINENYARELMELHTLGVDGGYTQKDVEEVARVFTGWSMGRPQQGGGFRFVVMAHDKGDKTVLGQKIRAGGMEEGLQVIHLLATHPSTARHISLKLAQRFVSDTPPEELVEQMANTFTQTGGDIRAVLRTLFASRHFWSPEVQRAKMKSPLEMVASTLRGTEAELRNPLLVARALEQMGQPLYRKQEPTGYDNTSAEWLNSAGLLARMNFAVALSENKLMGVRIDTARYAETAKQMGGPEFQKR
ncbi:MAG: DUF1800 domain-containing protein [Bryobacter sp.]|nr:DUF1800 domain-containing protein [Bryobacter sp.]